MAEPIITSEKPSTTPLLDPPSRIVCHVCQKQFSQYTCPRCNSRYCSLHCYKSHNLRCTESFMRENVEGELGQLGPDDETKQKMLDILKRFHSEEEADAMDDDEAGSTLSEETIQKVLSGGQVSFDDLSAEEKKLFQKAVASGELSKMVKPWDPWWLKPSARTITFSKEGTQLIKPLANEEESMSTEDDLESNQANEIPPGPDTPLPPVSKLSSTKPSPTLAVHLVDIIYSYCFTLRLYNGDWLSDATGSAMVLLSVSSVLGQGGQPETVLEALSYCLEQTCSPAFRQMGGLQFGLGLIDDVITLLTLGTPALLCLLCDLQRMVQAGERELKSEKPRKSRRAEIRSKLKLAERKIYFIMCWVHEQPGEAWSPLAAIVKAEKGSALNYEAAASRPGKVDKKAEPRSKVEGPKSPEEMLAILNRVVEESAPVLVAARLDAEERRNNIRLREEQDAAYRAALEADQARENQRREEQERLEREAAEAERKRLEEEEARERAAREAAEKEAALARMRQEKALSLGAEPEKGPSVTQVVVRFPTGERKERRFDSSAKIQTLYDYVDSLGCLDVENYSLVSNFPRVVYGPEKLLLSLKEAGLHPQASLFLELNS